MATKKAKPLPLAKNIAPSIPVNMTMKQKKNPMVAPMPKMVKKMGGRGR